MSFRRTLSALAVIAASASILAVATASGSVRPCTAAHISASMTKIAGSGSAGHIEYRLKLHNHGSAPCTLGNHPGLRLLRAKDQRLPTHVTKLGRNGPVTIKPGHNAGADLRFSPDVPGMLEPVHGRCEPLAHTVRVFLSPTVSVLGPVEPPTSVCEHGAIDERPLS